MPSPRVLITCADQYMGPVIHKKFSALGYDVVASTAVLADEAAVQTLVDDSPVAQSMWSSPISPSRRR